ncbi:MAG: hypothetical protein ACOYXM_07850 [Actinomycetota bacterium]
MAQRVLAVLGAVAIVLVAIVVRAAIDDDGGPGGSDDDGSELVVACDTDLAAYCEALTGLDGRIVEASDVTSLGILGGTLNEIDAWVTTDAWYEVTAGRSARPIGEAELLASSPIVVAADPDRVAAVETLCSGRATWRCLGDRAGEPWDTIGGQAAWGRLSAGLPDADTSTGLSVLAAVAIGYFGDADFAANEFDDAFASWLAKLSLPAPGGDPDPANTLVVRRGTYSVAGTTAARLSGISRPVGRVDAEPPVEAGIVLVRLAGGDDIDAIDQLRDDLVASGWTRASGQPEMMLKPGVLAALHTLWMEVAR